MKAKFLQKNKLWLISAMITVCFFALHLAGLTSLPVFADEAIYIRWAQLIIDDWRQYLFFSLNDGKTPLFIWLLVPFQFLFNDPLFAGRIVSVLIGAIQIWIMKLITAELGLSKRYQWLSMCLTAILPFWFFHHHLALMDGLLTLCLSLALWQTIKLVKKVQTQDVRFKQALPQLVPAGTAFGLAIFSKIPALLFFPSLLVMIFLVPLNIKSKKTNSWLTQLRLLNYILASVFIGLGIFLLLKLQPAFGQLFSRGNDFLFSWQEVLLESKWQETLPSWPTYLSYFVAYLTWPIMLLAVFSCFTKHKRQAIVLNLSWILYALPIFIMGKMVYPRYLFSVSLGLTLAAVIGFKELYQRGQAAKWLAISLILTSVIISFQFINPLLFAPKQTPFVAADQIQYLTEWSAGFGVKETYQLLADRPTNQTILVLSEGYFGTLPDGLLMYLHQQDVTNLFVTGIGQPIRRIQPEHLQLAQNYDQTWLVGNSHRLKLNLEEAQLLLESCRPNDAPCHQVWDMTALIKE